MAIQKNTAKAEEKPAEEAKPKAVAKAAAPKKEAAPKAAAKAKAEVQPANVTTEVENTKAPKIGRKEIAARIRDKVIAAGAAISPKVADIVAVAHEEVIQEALAKGEQVSLPGFGIFTSVAKPEAVRPNPQKKGETITVKAHNAPKFKAGAKFKAALNGGDESVSEADPD